MRELTAKTFANTISSDKPVLVDFWDMLCFPCRSFFPTLERLEIEYKNEIIFAKCNIRENQAIAEEYGILSLPTILIFKNGTVVEQIVGVTTAEKLTAILDELTE